MKGLDYYMDGLLDAHLNQQGPNKLTKDVEAFIKAFCDNLDVPEEYVRLYFEIDDDNTFWMDYREYYTSIVDAWVIWNAASKYFHDQLHEGKNETHRS